MRHKKTFDKYVFSVVLSGDIIRPELLLYRVSHPLGLSGPDRTASVPASVVFACLPSLLGVLRTGAEGFNFLEEI